MRNLACLRRAAVPVTFALVATAAIFITGCGNKAPDAAMPTASPTAAAPHTAASGPAITDKLSFSQLTLESPAKSAKRKNGVEYLKFRYADNDGKVYECELPKAMAEGQYTLAEWSSTFSVYRLPKVIAQKKVAETVSMGDFPFISPKPQQQESAGAQSQGQGSQPMQPLPAPSSSAAGSDPTMAGIPPKGSVAP